MRYVTTPFTRFHQRASLFSFFISLFVFFFTPQNQGSEKREGNETHICFSMREIRSLLSLFSQLGCQNTKEKEKIIVNASKLLVLFFSGKI